MKKIITILFLVVIYIGVNAQAPNWEWARQGIGDADVSNIITDNNGNIYVTGGFIDSSITFGPYSLPGTSGPIAGYFFLVKYDSLGNVLWARCSSSGNVGLQAGIAVDPSGNIYITGPYSGSISFGSYTINSLGGFDSYIVKYNSSGTVQWAVSIGDTGTEQTVGICTDQMGNSFVTGTYDGTSFSIGTTTLTNLYSTQKIFVAKFDSSGNPLWAVDNNDDLLMLYSIGIASDNSGNVYFTGYDDLLMTDSIRFGSVIIKDNGFIVKLDPSGNAVWGRTSINGTYERTKAITVNTGGKVLVTGSFSNNLTFGADSINAMPSSGGMFLTEFDLNGNPIWTRGFYGISSGLDVFSVASDNNGNTYISGNMDSIHPIIFDTLTLFAPLTGATYHGDLPIFVAKYDPNGNPLWGKSLRSGGDDWVIVAADNYNNVYFAGDFIPTSLIIGNDSLYNNAPNYDETPFLAKLSSHSGEMVSIPTVNSEQSITLYPNPATSSLTIRTENNKLKELHIYNVLGELVQLSEITNPESEIKMNVSKLKAGMYFVEIITERGKLRNKFIKQ